jgi:tRNA wybutosine-synthesizing protein 2
MAERFREMLEESVVVPQEMKPFLPSGFQAVGDIAIVNIKPEVLGYASAIAGAMLRRYPYVKSVWRRAGPISGELRVPQLEHIGGVRRSDTLHTENGCSYRIDVSRVMFSKGNVAERGRVAGLVGNGETVVDMFAGIGYFSLPIAKNSRAGMVYCIEKNPESIAFLRENIRLNSMEKRMVPIEGDCRHVRMGRVADRVLMGYLPDTHVFLPAAFAALKPSGGMIHYHDTFRGADLWDRPLDLLEVGGFRNGFRLREVTYKNVVKEYAPGVYHVVIDAAFEAAAGQ